MWPFRKSTFAHEQVEAKKTRTKQKWAAASDEEIAAHVRVLVAEEFSIEQQHMNNEVRFMHILDSTGGVELIMRCEEEAEVALSSTVGDFCAYIIGRLRTA